MTTSLMMGIVLLSLYWAFAVPLYVTRSAAGATAAVVLGLFFLGRAAACLPSAITRPSKGVAAVIVVALVIAAVGFPVPYNVGPILALIGIVGTLAFGSGTGCQPVSMVGTATKEEKTGCQPVVQLVWHSLAFGGFVLIAESIVVPVYLRVFSAEHNLPWLCWALAGLLALFGHGPALGESNVFVQTMRDLYGFPLTSERLALFTFATVFVGFVVSIAASPALRRSAARLVPLGLLVMVLYALVRYAVVVTVYLYLMHRMEYTDATSRVGVFWSPWWTAVTVFPLAWCLAGIAPRNQWLGRLDWLEQLLGPPPVGARYLPAAVVFAVVSAAAIMAAIALPEPSVRKPGRVLVDEYHSNWEKTTKPMDTTWYGQESGYNYYADYDYLSHFYETGRLEEPITTTTLTACDVLVIKIPTRRFDDVETKTIARFVREGGGLFLIGEHTNVFGSGVYINPIARSFGFEYRFDCLFDTARKFEELYRPPRLLPHPIVQNFPFLLFEVSCSIKPLSCWGEPIIIGTCLKALPIDYHAPNFYPQVVDRSDMDLGPFVQMWGTNYGKGRVVGFSDSTCFSNFCAFQPGKSELLLATIEWLNHRNSWGWWKVVWAALGAGFLLLTIVLVVRSNDAVRAASVVVFVVAGAVPLLAFGARQINREVCALPQPQSKVVRFYFEQGHCDYDLPIEGFVTQPSRSYDVFYQWVLRLGDFPSVGRSVEECTSAADAIVLIRPNREFSQKEIEELKAFVGRGGGLLVLDNPGLPEVAVQPLLRAFDLNVAREGQPCIGEVRATDGTTFTVESAWPIRGGQPLAWGAGGEVLAAAATIGNGSVVVASFADRFSDPYMGGGWGAKPNSELLAVYQMEYTFLRAAIAGIPAAAPRVKPAIPSTEQLTTATQPATRPTTATRTADYPTSR